MTYHSFVIMAILLSSKLLSFLCLLHLFISLAKSQPDFVHYQCMNDHGNFTANSTYRTNLNTLLTSLSSNTQIDYGFYNFSYGEIPNKVNAIGLCRGDVKVDACLSCLNDSRVLLTELCPNQKEAIGYYDNCMLRYTNRSIFGVKETTPPFYMWNLKNASDVDKYNEDVSVLLENLRSRAASGDSRRKFAAGNSSVQSFQTIYAHVQCTPDLSELDCSNCLVRVISDIPGKASSCAGKVRCRMWTPSCNLRFDTLPYYDLAAVDAEDPSPASSPSPPSSVNATLPLGKSKLSRKLVIAVVVPIVAIVVLLVLACICIKMKKSRRSAGSEVEADSEIGSSETLQLTFDSILAATNNFSESNKLGQGGFGPVYVGTLIDGQEIAVKRLSGNSSQGDMEFKNEVLLVARLQHRNLVRLLGFCLEGQERLLVYEFVPNKSLDYFIFDPIKRAQLSWEKRYKIIGGIARGLLYLHEDSRLRIIHRDLKASNILLDAEMNAKISDFGMARLVGVDQTQGNTSRIVGTFGYMAPEYAMHGQFSVKTDVFSFGVLVLEIVSGHKNSGVFQGENVEDLLSFAWKNWREGTAASIVDPAITGGSRDELMRCIHIGLLCVQENISDRPTMASVVLMLNSYSVTFPLPSQPATYMSSRIFSSSRSGEYNSGATGSSELKNQSVQASSNEASITQPFPR